MATWVPTSMRILILSALSKSGDDFRFQIGNTNDTPQ